jgi:hypothetical protein
VVAQWLRGDTRVALRNTPEIPGSITSVPAAVSNFILEDASTFSASTKIRSSVILLLLAYIWRILSVSLWLFESSLPLSECGYITLTDVKSPFILFFAIPSSFP